MHPGAKNREMLARTMDGMAHRENGAQGATHGNRDNQVSLEQLIAAK